jgi:ribonuclease HI
MNQTTIFTDGASRGNPGPGGWGTIVVSGAGRVSGSGGANAGESAKVTELGGAEKNTTNNRMELQAVIAGLEFVAKERANQGVVVVYTDSKYVLRGATEWLAGWEAKGWKTAGKTEVLNRDLWEALSAAMSHVQEESLRKIDWHLLAGHVGVAGNEQADKIATAWADSLTGGKAPQLFSGSLSEYEAKIGADILNISHDTEQKEKRSGSKERSRAKAYSYISKVDGKILIHKTWAECEARVKGVKGALFKKSLSPQDEVLVVEEFEGIEN